MLFFIEVILPLALPKTFTYKVSEAEYHYIKKGMRVAVPFGKNRIYTALVTDLHQNSPQLYQAKEIHEILDESPVVTQNQIKHWQWIAEYYMANIGDVYKTAMPSGFLLESETMIIPRTDFQNPEHLSDDEFLIYQALQKQSSIKIQEAAGILNKKNIFPVINKMLKSNVLSLKEEITEKYKPKIIRYIKLHSKYSVQETLTELLNSLSRAQKQKEVVLHYFQLKASEKKDISVKKLADVSGSSGTVIKSLIDKNIFEEYYLEQDRIYFQKGKNSDFQLSHAQQTAFDSVQKSFENQSVCLLHGITSSGKTEIYIKLIESYINKEGQVLFLLPEIAITTQLVMRLTHYFGNQVAVFHSKYTNNERIEVWQQILSDSQKARVVVGTRSAVFLPFKNLKLIIVDEEHEHTFKQYDPAPRYHARDAAIILANFFNAKVLLGSATPSIESYYNAHTGKYALVPLTERFGNVVLPEILLIDLKDKYKRKKMSGHFSDTLIEALSETLSSGYQAILFQNRRGFSPWVECLSCGHVPQCPQCDVSLTYYKYKNQLNCHYCGYFMAMPTHCHSCNSVDLSTKGFGTEQVEMELKQLFPEKKIWRMDHDTTKGKFGYEKIINAFKNQEADILVGTQMLAKGLHFDNVGIVGILNADNMLYQPDFRAFEKAFQMMTQVAGRAGRTNKGKVFIQTYNPLHTIIQQVTNNDYTGMYNDQINERKNFEYPPFYRLIKITLKHKDFNKLQESASWLYNVLVQSIKIPVLGPQEPAVGKIRNEYIKTILIKIPQQNSLIQTKKVLQKILFSFEAIPQYRSVKITVNVDNY